MTHQYKAKPDRFRFSGKIRSGYTLTELLVILLVILVLIALYMTQFQTVVGELRKSFQDFNEHTSTSHMLRQLWTDVETARNLTELAPDYPSQTRLAIESPDLIVTYIFSPETVVRTELNPELEIPQTTDTWTLPHIVTQWNIITHNDLKVGITIQTHLERTVRNHRQKKSLENSHMFFIDAESISLEKL